RALPESPFDQLAVGDIVFHIKNFAMGIIVSLAHNQVILRRRFEDHGFRQTQIHPERASLAYNAREPNAAAHGFGKASRECQSQPGALDVPLFRSQPLEGSEQFRDSFRRDSESSVVNAEPELLVYPFFTAQNNRAAPAVVFHGVREQIQEYLL